MSEKYQRGEFKWCKPAEAVFVMQTYLSKLELSLRNGEVPNKFQNGIQAVSYTHLTLPTIYSV